MPEWKKSKGLLVSEPDYVQGLMKQDASYVLVDLRDSKEAKKEHIPSAYTVPAKKLAKMKSKFPEDKSAPIILYTDDGIDEKSFNTVRAWGYKNVSVMNGGLAAWKQAEGNVGSGKMETKIVYVKKTPKGEITIDDFEVIVKKQPKDKVILDVRGVDEAGAGMFPGAVNIPLDDLESRMGELPKDKEIIIHCNTGIMAGMARKKLEQQGFKCRVLNAIVQVSADGTYEITEK